MAPLAVVAAWTESLAVSAAGRQGTFPANSTEALDVVPPAASNSPQLFIAQFSNVAPEIDLTGPGVASCLPCRRRVWRDKRHLHGLSGPTGAAAARLAAQPKVLRMKRNRDRAIAMLAVINAAAQPLGFTKNLEGLGMLP